MTKEELQENLRLNFDYGLMIPTAALYKKLYGEFPKCGMSGEQATMAQKLFEALPEINTVK